MCATRARKDDAELPIRKPEPDAEEYECLLSALDPDPRRASKRYDSLLERLTTIFAAARCRWPEDLADEALRRTARKCTDLRKRGEYMKSVEAFACEVGQYLIKEEWRKPRTVTVIDSLAQTPENDPAEQERRERWLTGCLDPCCRNLSHGDRTFIMEWYGGEPRAAIEHRRKLSERTGISLGTLRVRAHRIRKRIRICMSQRCPEFGLVWTGIMQNDEFETVLSTSRIDHP